MTAPAPPAWTRRFVGIPFAARASSLSGADCYGLAALIARECFGYSLPILDDRQPYADPSQIHPTRLAPDNWPTVPPTHATPGDLAIFLIPTDSNHRRAWHLATIAAPGWIIHTLAARRSTLDRFPSPTWSRFLDSIIRPPTRRRPAI